jgi:hypothetical protein
MRALAAADVLALWEIGAHRHALDRSALLCAWARPDLQVQTIVDLPLGAVTASLLRLREASFGAPIQAHVNCARCGERLELALVSSELLQAVTERACEIEVHGMRVRAPSLRDLAAVADELDTQRAARLLLARCILQDSGDATGLPDEAFREVEDALEALDANADLALEVRCEICGHGTIAQLDAGALLWDEIAARARTLLYELHVLASAYGWTEGDILALSPARRAAYLGMVAE